MKVISQTITNLLQLSVDDGEAPLTDRGSCVCVWLTKECMTGGWESCKVNGRDV